MKTVILAAGKSQRFLNEGFALPLPLLVTEQAGEFTSVVQSSVALAKCIHKLFGQKAQPIVVCSPHVFLNIHHGVTLVESEYCQNGSAMSAYLASGHIALDEEVVIIEANSTFYNHDALAQVLLAVSSKGCDAATGYCQIPAEDFEHFNFQDFAGIQTIGTEKFVCLPTTTDKDAGKVLVGIYYFKTLRILQEGILKNARACLEQNLENTMALALLSTGKTISTFGVSYSSWTPLHTPHLYDLAVKSDDR